MKNNSKFVDSLLKDLKNTSKYLTEAYIFDEHGEEMPMEHSMEPGMEGDSSVVADGPSIKGGGIQPQMQQANGENAPAAAQSAEEQAMHAQEVIQHEPIVGKIRETAIEGLKKYADHPTSEIYAFFKDVFLSSDKLLTGKNGKK